MSLRSDKFEGQTGKYNTVFNALVRRYGYKIAKYIQQSSNYEIICQDLTRLAKYWKDHKNQNVTHPNYKVPAWYGMTEEVKEKLKNENKRLVTAYETDWLNNQLDKGKSYKLLKYFNSFKT